ncbi:MAG: SDR family oxidoreductase [Eubacterium sp.]|nr:SDR family oxidoreductase [Eubacterium sp.]
MDVKSLFGYEGKNVVITGAGSGMGKAAAKLLVELGANVYATVRRKPLDFAVTKEIKSDLSSKEGVDAIIPELPDSIDALFVCHGISNTLGKTNALEVQKTNFYSFKYLTELLLPRITDNGSVNFISSDGGKNWRSRLPQCLEVIATKSWDEALAWYEAHPDETGDGYVFAKECQIAYVFSKCHSPEFIDRKIRLNAIAPGMTKTGLTDDFNKSVTGDAVQGQAILEKYSLEFWNGRWASPEEMGYPLAAIGSSIFSYMSGQVLYIDYGTASLWEIGELTKAEEKNT